MLETSYLFRFHRPLTLLTFQNLINAGDNLCDDTFSYCTLSHCELLSDP
jgi:hypothetical protein